ncbi:MAG: oligoribonuclease [Dehalococcoidia bacterium]
MDNDKTKNLVWIDLEMTGLEEKKHVIIEIASLVTDSELNELAIGPIIAINRSHEELSKINAWSKEQHAKSGLLERVNDSSISISEAEKMTLKFLKKFVAKGSSPICGNSIGTDRRFIRKEMPKLDAFLHYRMIDVSTIKELVARWYPDKIPPQKKCSHLAMDDIKESVEELRWYRENIFAPNSIKI